MAKGKAAIQSSGKGWLQKLKGLLKMSGELAAVALLAPLKLPGKVLKGLQLLVLVPAVLKATENKEVQDD